MRMTEPYRTDGGLPESPGRCPRCPSVVLEPRAAGELRVALCRSCHGLWVADADMLDLAIAPDDELRRLYLADAGPARGPAAVASCPRCGVTMARHDGSGTAVDVCSRHGLWFDAGELRALLIRAGFRAEPPRRWLARIVAWLSRRR